ncbi:hypothetical protein QOZ80_1BG0079300 [Eleusine coracana subsp. coracana]|nr:hypothetical protein QOZ80_1BG0079300 [Eleusine coracana subsp. coracana]
MSMDDTPAPALTLGESLAHVSRDVLWTTAVLPQIAFPVGLTWILVDAYRSDYSPTFFSSVPWRLPLLLSLSAYGSLFFMMISYAELFLPRTPLALVKKIEYIGGLGVGLTMCVMGNAVLATEVKNTSVLVGCTCVEAAVIAGLVAFWVWLARTYGGDALESPTMPPDDNA